jgi:hypothetical protein
VARAHSSSKAPSSDCQVQPNPNKYRLPMRQSSSEPSA